MNLYGDTMKNDAKYNKSRKRLLEVSQEILNKWRRPRKAKKWQSRISSGIVREYGAKIEFQPRRKCRKLSHV